MCPNLNKAKNNHVASLRFNLASLELHSGKVTRTILGNVIQNNKKSNYTKEFRMTLWNAIILVEDYSQCFVVAAEANAASLNRKFEAKIAKHHN